MSDMTDEERQSLDIVMSIIDGLREAIATKNWPKAREIWELMTPLHAQLIEHEPSMVHIATALQHQEALVLMAERQSNSTH